MKLTLTIKEAATVTGISPLRLRRMMLSGSLKGYVSPEKKALRPSLYSILVDVLAWPADSAVAFARDVFTTEGKLAAADLRRRIIDTPSPQLGRRLPPPAPAVTSDDPVLRKHRRFCQELHRAPRRKGTLAGGTLEICSKEAQP